MEEDTVYLDIKPELGERQINYYGQEWDEDADGPDYPPNGDWKNYGANCLRMGEDWIPEDANAFYMFDLGYDKIKPNMKFGIFFADWSAHPTAGGPDLLIRNWETNSWKKYGNVGDHDKKKWVWKELGDNTDDFVSDEGFVWVKIHTAGEDDTILDTISVIYEPIVANLACSGDLDFGVLKPGATGTGSFTVKNIGGVESKLNWEIKSWPSWGIWTISPKSGSGLLGGQSTKIDVQLQAPSSNGEYNGIVKVVNLEDSSDFCDVEVSLVVKKSRSSYNTFPFIKILLNKYPFLINILSRLNLLNF